MKIAVIQLDAQGDPEANLDAAVSRVNEAADGGAGFIALPEVFHLRVGKGAGRRYVETASAFEQTCAVLAQTAADRGVTLLAGSITEPSPDPDRVYNTSVLLGPDGKTLATYRKVHLFDVNVGSEVAERESKRFMPGSEVVSADTAIGHVGLTVCYDLRFPELYRALALRGATLITVPANFTRTTGEAHWMTLLRARAIENAAYVVAPNQCGAFTGPAGGGFEAYGHSAVIDPWGRVLLEMDDRPGVGYAEIDPDEARRVREAVPVLRNRMPDVYGL
ncbi:MAG: carbon-nitrogen hydrolase family protein [Phycisphaerales bacterium JB063]